LNVRALNDKRLSEGGTQVLIIYKSIKVFFKTQVFFTHNLLIL